MPARRSIAWSASFSPTKLAVRPTLLHRLDDAAAAPRAERHPVADAVDEQQLWFSWTFRPSVADRPRAPARRLDDAGVVGQGQRHPAAHRVADQRDRHAGVCLGDLRRAPHVASGTGLAASPFQPRTRIPEHGHGEGALAGLGEARANGTMRSTARLCQRGRAPAGVLAAVQHEDHRGRRLRSAGPLELCCQRPIRQDRP